MQFAEGRTQHPLKLRWHGSWHQTMDCSHSGTRSIDHLNENLGAIDVQLTPADLREMAASFSRSKCIAAE
jgi:aryl-alcohol dehydrogenase-like predicted oxidoreductase